MTTRTQTLTALVAMALAVGAAPAAHAETVKLTNYELTFDARVDYQHVTNFSTANQSSHTKLDVSSHLLGKMDVTFANGRLQATSGGAARGFTTAEYKADSTDFGSHETGHCTANPGLPVTWGAPSIGEPELGALVNPEIDLRLSESSLQATRWDSCTGSLGQAIPDLGDPSKQLGEGPLDAVFTMPTDAIGNGKIIQLVSGPPSGSASFCPDNEDPTTTSCTYGWTGTVTLTKTGESTFSDGTGPAGSGGGSGAKGTGGKKKPTASTSSKAKANAKGTTVSFDADCPLGCAGIAHLKFGSASKASAAAKAGKAIRFRVKAGAKRKVILRLSKPAARKLRRARRATLQVTLTPNGGSAVKRSLKVK